MERYFVEHAIWSKAEFFLYTENKLIEYAKETYYDIDNTRESAKELSILTDYKLEDLDDVEVALDMLNEYYGDNITFAEAIIVD